MELSPLPAPVWFVLFFKVLGFLLHLLFMHLWLVVLPLALFLGRWGGEQARCWSARAMRQMPIFITFGVNLGIVPLLFIQLLYPRAFYSATILMAWHWMLIIVLLIPAYYGVYLYTLSLKKNPLAIPAWRQAAGWVAAAMFLAIGFLFVNGLVLTAHPDSWEALWQGKNLGGAALGTGSAVRDGTFFPRWILMFGLALGTAAAWTLADREWFLSGSDLAYRDWTNRWARTLSLTGAVIFGLAGSVYIFQSLPLEMRGAMFSWKLVLPTFLAAVGPIASAVAIWLFTRPTSRSLGNRPIWIPVGVQVLALAANAVSRQTLQVLELNAHTPLGKISVASEWSAAAMFLLVFLAGVATLIWMCVHAVSEDSVALKSVQESVLEPAQEPAQEPAKTPDENANCKL